MTLNETLSRMFKTMAAVLEIRGEPVFKAIAFTKVARRLEDETIDLRAAVESAALGGIEGIGKSSAKVIEEFVRTGRSDDYSELVSTVPAGLIDMLTIGGLGPKTIALLWRERGITGIEELSKAIAEGKLEGLRGVGEKKIEQIKQGIELRALAGQRIGLVEALPIAQSVLRAVREFPQVHSAEAAGSLRRGRESIGDVDLIVALKPDLAKDASAGDAVTAAFVSLPIVQKALGQGPTKASILTDAGLQVDLRVVPLENFGAALQYFTGSKEHNVRLRGLAQDKGLTLNEWGLYDQARYERAEKKPGQAPPLEPIASRTEAEVYQALGLEYIEPELREDRGEIDLAATGKLPTLVTAADLRGELHCHTTASDGIGSAEQMIDRAVELGLAYIVITDHSRSQVVANGLTPQRMLRQIELIRGIAARRRDIAVLVGSEVDILVDGSLDYDDDLLRELDFVVASPHASLRQDQEKATARILRAIQSKYVNLIGHPTGRLINQRAGLPLQFDRVFAAAASSGTALEINAAWPRLDLSDTSARAALAAGCTLSIDTDAHSPADLGHAELGVRVARRAGASAARVLNCGTLEQLRRWVAAKRDR